MCRLMGFASKRNTSLASIAGSHFDQFTQLAELHKDGWGFSSDSEFVKEVLPARKSETFQSVISQEERAALLHFRWASPGLAIEQNNSHPFHRDGVSFIHNGSITPGSTIDFMIDTQLLSEMTGTTDSERYFLALLTALRSEPLTQAFLQTIRTIRGTGKAASLNAMVLTPELFVVAADYDLERIPAGQPNDYYSLAYKKEGDGVIVASSGWDQSGWIEIPNHTMMVVNRSTLELDFISI